MPTYDYRCTDCGREVEVMHGIYASGPGTCEHCGGAMRKALSPPAIHFKGKGWAKKDAAAATAKKAAPKPASTSDSSKPADEAKAPDGDVGKSEKSSSTKSEDKSKAAPTAGNTTE